MARPKVYRNVTTGQNKRLYSIWERMKARCYNSSCKDYKNYGARGIEVCKEWLEWDTFYEWAITNEYRESLTLDRIDVNGNYEPSNCRWATQQEQARNTRLNRIIDGVSMAEYAEKHNLKYSTVRSRLRYGFQGSDLQKPPKTAITVEGIRLDVIGQMYNIPVTTLKSRYYDGIDTISEIIKPRKHTGRKKGS